MLVSHFILAICLALKIWKRLSISKDISKFSFCIKNGAKTVHIYDYRFHNKHEYLHGIYVLQ